MAWRDSGRSFPARRAGWAGTRCRASDHLWSSDEARSESFESSKASSPHEAEDACCLHTAMHVHLLKLGELSGFTGPLSRPETEERLVVHLPVMLFSRLL